MSWQSPTLEKLLRLAVICCFAGHGTLALLNATTYTSEWSAWVQSLFAEQYKYELSAALLRTVGTIDIIVAGCFMLPKIPLAAFGWAILWAAATATSRIFFLGSFQYDFWYFQVRPLGEFIIRTPNWLVGLMLLVASYPELIPERFRIFKFTQFLWVAAFSQALGLLLHYLVELNHPMFPWEIEKINMPIWYFHGMGLVSFVATMGCLTVSLQKNCSRQITVAASMFSLAALLAQELFNTMVRNAPHGLFYAGIRVVEAMPMYICLTILVVKTLTDRDRLNVNATQS